jgi:Bacterial PH domain
MVDVQSIEKQLTGLGFKLHGWGRTEVKELRNIILPGEKIFECANGFYEGGFALLLATDVRVLLVDKKPLNYLTVEDMRFDMINEIDYSHRLFGANIRISAGETQLKFTSINQQRLRKLIGHVQHSMAEAKKNQATHPHLEQINQQLRSYLLRSTSSSRSFRSSCGQSSPTSRTLRHCRRWNRLS